MPKRERNSELEDNYGLQYKIRVTPKEVNCGVNSQRNMQPVYDRTLRLLQMGANVKRVDLSSVHTTESHKGHNISVNWNCVNVKHTMQLQINTSGKLCSNNNNLFHSNLQQQLGQFTALHCQNCSSSYRNSPTGNEAGLNRCNFCEQRFCSHCLYSCHICFESYCSRCSTTLFGEESITCLSCATTSH